MAVLGLDFLAFDFFFLALAAFLLVASFEEVELSLPLDLALESLESCFFLSFSGLVRL